MKRQGFKLTLLTDVVITANSATQGEHEALDFIPGSLIRGSAISNTGSEFKPELFFSGKIRFHNAYPMAQNGEMSIPIPSSFHKRKLGDQTIFNGVFDLPEEQVEQMRGNYMSGNQKITVDTTYRMKTAIDRNKGYTSQDSQLFGYQSIKAGTTFGCFIDFDDDVKTEDMEKIIKGLTSNYIRLGKSRSAEYGLVKAEKLNTTSDYKQGQPEGNKTVIYLASDLCLEENGIYVTRLKPEHFGLANGTAIDWKHSFVRIRKYSPWNAFWKGRMRERQVIRKGSVITLTGSVDPAKLKAKFEKGFGLFREEGLGRLLVNPSFICNKKPALEGSDGNTSAISLSELPAQADSDKNLLALLKHRTSSLISGQDSKKRGIEWAKFCYSHWYSKYGIENCPGKSQWGTIREISTTYHNKQCSLIEALDSYCNHGTSSRQWNNSNAESQINDRRFTLYGYIKETILNIGNEDIAAAALLICATEISKMIARGGN